MKGSFIHFVFIVWHTLNLLEWGSAQTPNCRAGEPRCVILGSNGSTCIPPKVNGDQHFQNFTLRGRRVITYECHWPENCQGTEYKLNLKAPEGWRVLLRVNSTRNIRVKAGDIDGQYSEDADGACNRDKDGIDSTFDSIEDRYFYKADHFVSRTSSAWITIARNEDRDFGENSNFSEVFNVIARIAKIKYAVSTGDNLCMKNPLYSWKQNGYHADDSSANGFLSLQCDNSFPLEDVLISFLYQMNISKHNPPQCNGLIQLVYNGSSNLITDQTPDLYLEYGFTKCTSFWIQFNASGEMDLYIYNVTVQGLIFEEKEETILCPSETFPSTQSQDSTTPSLSQISANVSTLSAPTSLSTTAEVDTSFTQVKMTTDNSLTRSKRQALGSKPIFLIPTVSVVAISMLISVAVLSICCRKRYRKKQSKDRDATSLYMHEDPVSSNNERHDYYEVRPSGKPPSGGTIAEITDPFSAGNDSYCKMDGAMSVSKNEGTVDSRPDSHDGIKKVGSPTTRNRIIVKGQEYVDMDKKAHCKEKTEMECSFGKDFRNDHEVKILAAKNRMVVNGQEYAEVGMDKKALERKEKDAIARNSGKDLGNDYDDSDEVESSAAKNRIIVDGQEYATVDMDKKASQRKKKSKRASNPGKELGSDDDKAYAILQPDKTSNLDESGETCQMVQSSSPKSSSIKKDLAGAQYENVQVLDKGLTNIHKPPDDNSNYDERQPFRSSPTDPYEEVLQQVSDKDITDIHKPPEDKSNYDDPRPFGSSPTEPYDELQINPSVSSDFSQKSDHPTKGKSGDDLADAYQTVRVPSSTGASARPDSYPNSDYEIVSPPMSPGVVSIRSGQYPSNDYKTTDSQVALPVEPMHCPIDTYETLENENQSIKRDPSMTHTYEDPVAMAQALDRPYDKLQRGPLSKKQTTTPKTSSSEDRKVTEVNDQENALNLYDEISIPATAPKEWDESTETYQHLQRPLSKRPKGGAPLPEIPGDQSYGSLNLEGTGASYQSETGAAAAHQDQKASGPPTTETDPDYVITLEKPAEAKPFDDDDPDYDLLDAFK